MTESLNNYFSELTKDTVILTPNRRLAAVLHELYIDYQQQQKLTCWQKPTILSINAWLETLWQQYLNTATDIAPTLLNATQARLIWETIVSRDPSHNLLQVTETAESLKTAWELIWQYEVNIEDPAFQLTDDYALCQQWLREYQHYCTEKNYIDNATLPHFLTQKIEAGEIKLPNQILLYGFTELIPLYMKLLGSEDKQLRPSLLERRDEKDASQMKLLGSDNKQLSPTLLERRDEKDAFRSAAEKKLSRLVVTVNNKVDNCVISLNDPDSEIIAMARFAKATLEAHPDANIGCVVLDLNQRRERILQLFTQVFFPDQPFDVDPIHYPFNISAGKKLGSYPIIATALAICGLTKEAITREQFSSLLLSPYISEAETKREERAKLDAELRRKNIHFVDHAAWREIPAGACPRMFLAGAGMTKNFHDWAQYFNNMLCAYGWPGEKSLSSEEYQVAQAWLVALADLASLDKISAPVTKKTAWQQLRQIVNSQIFQPQSPKTGVQVLGLLEAAAVPFDYLWVAGMNDLSWPPQPNPHPLIPKSLQRALNMPHATAERELHFCTTILEQFKQASKQLIFSHAESDGKIDFKPSSLLQDIPVIELASIAQADYTEPANTIFAKKQTETFNDSTAPAIPTHDKISGGADVIKQQAACPFRAFATHRLHARELEASTQGLNQKDRGIILHEVMQHLWSEIKSQENLLAIEDTSLKKLIDKNIELAIHKNAPIHHHNTQYLALEKSRLNKLILNWLALEKTRPPFFVSTREEDAQINLQGRQLSVRIDRIDTLSDGRKLVIDYKSGVNNSVKKWFGERPDEPQLPLYALIDTDNTIGISFAQLAAGNTRFKGMGREALAIAGIDSEADTWSEKLTTWRETLEQLMADFIAGDAIVNPKRPSDTCKNCALTSLCRIHEITDPTCEDEVSEEMAYE